MTYSSLDMWTARMMAAAMWNCDAGRIVVAVDTWDCHNNPRGFSLKPPAGYDGCDNEVIVGWYGGVHYREWDGERNIDDHCYFSLIGV